MELSNSYHCSETVKHFRINGKLQSIEKTGNGYINNTYRIITKDDDGNVYKYILQRINTNVFRDCNGLMNNYQLVSEHLKDTFFLEGGNGKAGIPFVILTNDGKNYYRDETGAWRIISYFDDVYAMDVPKSSEIYKLCGKSFGKFIKALSDIDPKDINITIPNFHNTHSRYLDLEEAIRIDKFDRVKEVGKEIDFVRKHREIMPIITEALERGEIPTRITHNDTNLNNILFDKNTDLPVAIIDLDTIMPSSVLYDYGDSLRIGASTACDDEKDLSKVKCDLDLYEKYTMGFIEGCGDVLTKREKELLPIAAIVITLEDGIRFLMDYINGDTYYKTSYEGQNLDRARTQLKLVEDMENQSAKISSIVEKALKAFNL